MKTKTLRTLKVFTIIAFILCALFTIFACDNLTSDIIISYTPPIASADETPSNQEITISGRISTDTQNLAGAYPAGITAPDGNIISAGISGNSAQNRMALPSMGLTGLTADDYYIKATAPGASERTGTVDASEHTFSIPLALGYKWTVELGVKTQATGETARTVKLKATYTFDHDLAESDVSTPISLSLAPFASENGTGNIDLQINAGSYSYTAEAVREPSVGAWAAANPDCTDGITASGIKSGAYVVLIIFRDSTSLEVFSCEQTINVFDNLTTTVWLGDGGSLSPINSSNQFALTSQLIAEYARTNFYVASESSTPAGDDTTGNGSSAAPYATVSRAVSAIKTTNPGRPCTIRLKSDITENISLDSTLTTSAATSLTIKGYGANRTVGKGSNALTESAIICVNTPVPVTLDNLTVTGGSTGTAARGIYNGNGMNLTLKDCSVTGNGTGSADVPGGGVYNGGTLRVSGRINITGNTKGSGSDVTASNVYLPTGKVITVVGALDATSGIGVSTQTAPTNETPVVVTGGFGTNNPGVSVSSIFTGDAGYAVVPGTGTSAGEVALTASGGSFSGGIPSGNLVFAFKSAASGGSDVTSFVAGFYKEIYVTARTSASSDPIAPSEITYSFILKCGNHTVATLTPTAQGNAVKVMLPASVNGQPLYPDSYTLHVAAAYDGTTYDTNLALEGEEPASSGSSGSLPDGFVAVTGATVSGAVSGSSVFITGRSVTIPNMYVCDHEVTQTEYIAIMGTNPSEFNGSEGKEPANGENQENRPVEKVNWYAAIAYCNKKSITEGLTPCYSVSGISNWASLAYDSIPTSSNDTWNAATCDFSANGYRLPTEAEWEYAARGGNNGIPATQYTYSGSNTVSNVTWYYDNSGNKTHEVKKKTANSLGLYDMSGNVWEWCWNWSSSMGGSRSGRGGSWDNEDTSYCAVSHRNTFYPDQQYNSVGFRVVRTTWYAHETPTTLPAGTNGTAGTSATYILFGDYPQTIIAYGVTVDEDISKEMGAFTYYLGSDGAWYVKVSSNYYKVEPVKWRVITTDYDHDGNSSTPGAKVLLAENILTATSFYDGENSNRTIGGNEISQDYYKHSRLRALLNGLSYNKDGTDNTEFNGKGFLQTAFTSGARSLIFTTEVNNSKVVSDAVDQENTNDQIFALSATECNAILPNATNRIRTATDFAVAKGGSGNDWWLRSPRWANGNYVYKVGSDGNASNRNVVFAHGVVPALCIDN